MPGCTGRGDQCDWPDSRTTRILSVELVTIIHVLENERHVRRLAVWQEPKRPQVSLVGQGIWHSVKFLGCLASDMSSRSKGIHSASSKSRAGASEGRAVLLSREEKGTKDRPGLAADG